MKEFPKDIKFKYSWRKYQQRVLDELDKHLNDRKLHVIAPPGSGKTVLGLEVARRLNKPTLVLAPTIAIRNQWIQRFCELFLQTTQTPDWISRDIRNPKFMTVVTYQGLHAACNNSKVEELEIENEEENEEIETDNNSEFINSNLDQIVKGLKSVKVETIVVDEAHHLKNEWWHTLIKVSEHLDSVIVGLTATPPYDVSPAEWQRYLDLNGAVDTEISVPELVIEGDLCPHQDYVHFTFPSEKEYQSVLDFRQNIQKIYKEIIHDDIIIQAIQQHPIWIKPEEHLDWIYNNLSYYSACIIILNHNKIAIGDRHLEIIGEEKIVIPFIDYSWVEIFLDFYLFKEKEHFNTFDNHRKALENRLRRYGAIERKQIKLSENKRITGFLTSSISKLNGINKIVEFEFSQLGRDLRLVILSDYIRKEYFPNTSENNLELNKIGVIPIFEKLRRENKNNKRIGVLTGSIIIIPAASFSTFEALANSYGITKISSSLVPYDQNYIQIIHTEQLKHDVIHIITQIFQEGEIEVLIGTKSLLGEGWDAPAINALVLASFVGSFVLSNQMRGRAIRTQKNNTEKTGNIWHLVCVDPTSNTGGDDFDLLKRRFRSFVGVSFHQDPTIENGIGRLNLPHNIHFGEDANKRNEEMFEFAMNREGLKNKWNEALAKGVSLVEEIKIPFDKEQDYERSKELYFNKTIKNLLVTLGFLFAVFFYYLIIGSLKNVKLFSSFGDWLKYLGFCFIFFILYFFRQTYKTFRLFIQYRDISKDIQAIGEALLISLSKAGEIRSDRTKLKVVSSVDKWGGVYCHLEGGSAFDKSTFINALQEVISPINNPRYVIIRKSEFLLFLKQQDYHAVPESLGRKKSTSIDFQNQWQQYVGQCDLIFTRNLEGRKLLLKSRLKSLAAQFNENIEHVSKWK